mgnify:CR=1 FL=1
MDVPAVGFNLLHGLFFSESFFQVAKKVMIRFRGDLQQPEHLTAPLRAQYNQIVKGSLRESRQRP